VDQSPWKDLPNATQIDRILDDMKSRSKVWSSPIFINTLREMTSGLDWPIFVDKAKSEAYAANMRLYRTAVLSAAADHIIRIAKTVANYHARYDAAHAILALIVWDDCGYILDTSPKNVHLMALIGHSPSILLLPAVTALHHE
jgi:hypothetical protein